MKPDWDRLMAHFDGSEKLLVADVDCTTEGKPLCTTMQIKSFPSLMYGKPGSPLKKYTGSRGFDDLQKFAESLGGVATGGGVVDDEEDPDVDPDLADGKMPEHYKAGKVAEMMQVPKPTTTTTTTTQCFLDNEGMCSDAMKKSIAEYRGFSVKMLDGLIKAKTERMEKNKAAGKPFHEENMLRLLNEVRAEKTKESAGHTEL